MVKIKDFRGNLKIFWLNFLSFSAFKEFVILSLSSI